MQLNKLKSFFTIILGIFFIILLSPIVILFLLLHFLQGKWLGFLVRQSWYSQGKFLLFIYSDSPNWKEYIEQNILPQIFAKAVIINWSEKEKWKKKNNLELSIFQYWTGVAQYFIFNGKKRKRKWLGAEFCPIAIIFYPWWKPKVVKFWQGFKDFKHGKDLNLKKCEKELFEILNNFDSRI